MGDALLVSTTDHWNGHPACLRSEVEWVPEPVFFGASEGRFQHLITFATNHTYASPLHPTPCFHPRSTLSGAPTHSQGGTHDGKWGWHPLVSWTAVRFLSDGPLKGLMVSSEGDLGQARLSGRGLAVGLGGQSVANGVKIYIWGYRGRITGFIYEPEMKHVL